MASNVNTIERISVDEDRFGDDWGIQVNDYWYSNAYMDLQDLLVAISNQRALAIEREVDPLQEIIMRRNDRLDAYTAVVARLTEMQAMYDSDGNSNATISFASLANTFGWDTVNEILSECSCGTMQYALSDSEPSLTASKSTCEGLVSRAKSIVDEMNNESQKDMNRLQAIVDRRDEAFSTSTTLMQAVSDTRTDTIKSLS